MFNRNSTLFPRINISGTNRNLRLSPPKSDTCKTCDGFTVKIQNCGPGDSNEIFFYENDLKLHREEVNEGYKTITKMSKIVKEDPHKLVIAVDLQQALPTLHSCTVTQRSERHCYESEYQPQNLADLPRDLYVISDNCFGQNKK